MFYASVIDFIKVSSIIENFAKNEYINLTAYSA